MYGNSVSPRYLADLITPSAAATARTGLRFATPGSVAVPRTTSSLGDSSFAVAAPRGATENARPDIARPSKLWRLASRAWTIVHPCCVVSRCQVSRFQRPPPSARLEQSSVYTFRRKLKTFLFTCLGFSSFCILLGALLCFAHLRRRNVDFLIHFLIRDNAVGGDITVAMCCGVSHAAYRDDCKIGSDIWGRRCPGLPPNRSLIVLFIAMRKTKSKFILHLSSVIVTAPTITITVPIRNNAFS